jgi:hypothetical protein
MGVQKSAEYRIVVRGELDARYAYLFDGMHVERGSGTTVLTGEVIDQVQLNGLFEQIEELGLDLLSVEQLDQPERRQEGMETA